MLSNVWHFIDSSFIAKALVSFGCVLGRHQGRRSEQNQGKRAGSDTPLPYEFRHPGVAARVQACSVIASDAAPIILYRNDTRSVRCETGLKPELIVLRVTLTGSTEAMDVPAPDSENISSERASATSLRNKAKQLVSNLTLNSFQMADSSVLLIIDHCNISRHKKAISRAGDHLNKDLRSTCNAVIYGCNGAPTSRLEPESAAAEPLWGRVLTTAVLTVLSTGLGS